MMDGRPIAGSKSHATRRRTASTDTIHAKFNYIVDTGVPPVRYIDWPEMEHKAVPPQYRQYEMAVRNGRPLRDTFKLDIHGFVFAEHETQVRDFTDEAERKRVYDPEVQALIRKHSGASDVVVFDHTIRVSDEEGQKADRRAAARSRACTTTTPRLRRRGGCARSSATRRPSAASRSAGRSSRCGGRSAAR